MLQVTENIIAITRGDSDETNITVNNSDGTLFVPAEGDKVLFIVRNEPKVADEPPLIEKDVTDGKLTLYASDTKDMDYGSYLFGIKIEFAEGLSPKTVMKGQFVVTAQV